MTPEYQKALKDLHDKTDMYKHYCDDVSFHAMKAAEAVVVNIIKGEKANEQSRSA